VLLYQKVGVPLYIIVDYWTKEGKEGEEKGDVHLVVYRATPEGYVRVLIEGEERYWIEPLKIWLVGGGKKLVCLDEQEQPIPAFLEITETARNAAARAEELETLNEEAILAQQEAERNAKLAEERAQQEERLRQDEERLRLVAESRAKDEERLRLEADKRAKDEERLRLDTEQRLQDLEDELRRLRSG
jgi:hypothetical protein